MIFDDAQPRGTAVACIVGGGLRAPAVLPAGPVGADLFEDVELVAPQARQGLAELSDHARVLGALLLGDDVTIGLKQHWNESLCHNWMKLTNLPSADMLAGHERPGPSGQSQ